jgi:hypothetical protein
LVYRKVDEQRWWSLIRKRISQARNVGGKLAARESSIVGRYYLVLRCPEREQFLVGVRALYRCPEGAWQRIQQLGEAKGRLLRFLLLHSGWSLCMQERRTLPGSNVRSIEFSPCCTIVLHPNRRYMSRPGGIWVMTQTYSVIFR